MAAVLLMRRKVRWYDLREWSNWVQLSYDIDSLRRYWHSSKIDFWKGSVDEDTNYNYPQLAIHPLLQHGVPSYLEK
jgi:hypothetical protein